ncbi:MAG: 3-oxoacyl-[acyl-carrier-protein] synthase III C-terminal domain-containing protein [Verrucomicrobiota bacterium]|jgi:predicted naringenin-chalcone synthase|nr:stilbene synthase [Verrucomicrobiota bacterium]MDG1891087.1 3-oxoacyl-[acyl-carrier-protein] synthase III C-terminal domain-containing protein [Verrucomicrobiota bacterium]
MSAFIHAVSHARPQNVFTQEACLAALRQHGLYSRLNNKSHRLLNRVMCSSSGIHQRFLALDAIADGFVTDPDTLHRRFEHHAPLLATAAAQRALQKAGRDPSGIDAVLVSTCTGYLCPGLSTYVSEQLGLRPDAILLDLVGQGCAAAIPNLQTAHALIEASQANSVLSVCVEVCSAAFYLDDDPGVIISACLFGDAAGAMLLEKAPPSQGRHVRWIQSYSHLEPDKRELLRFTHRRGMLRNILSAETPQLAASSSELLLKKALKDLSLRKDDISAWVTHAGGKRVIESLQTTLQLKSTDLAVSRNLLRDYGNTSSSFVMLALERHLEDTSLGGHWWMHSFGAGFSSHGLMLHVD